MVSLVVLLFFTGLCVYLIERNNHNRLLEAVGCVGTLVGLIALFIVGCSSIPYIGASYKAEIVNQEYGTSYTAAQIFYASDVIEDIRELKRTRIEVNGNLITGQD